MIPQAHSSSNVSSAPSVVSRLRRLWFLLLLPVFAAAGFDAVFWTQHYQRVKSNDHALAEATVRIVLGRFAQDRDAQKAREGLLEALKEDPSYPSPRFYLGFLSEELEDWEGAITSFRAFCDLEPSSDRCATARLEIKRLAEVQTDSPQALKDFRYSQKIRLAKSALGAGSPKSAVMFASQASAIDDTRWEAYAIGAAALTKQKQFDDAAKFLGMAMDRAPADTKPKLQAALDQCNKEKQYAAFALAGAQALQAKQYQVAAAQFDQA
ncbi:MAG: hypothetical protein WCE23_01165 [Candidatus Binatus sp.]|uniref:tetratricopeptide repeat protein n=1 Tax=Candidatus Binatus sp. TaxID=2811406 RepID=UPI003C740553